MSRINNAFENDRDFADLIRSGLLDDQVSAEISEIMQSNPKAQVLEVGCGFGAALVELHYLFPDGEFEGIDIVPLKSQPKEFKFTQMNVEQLDRKKYYDIIFSGGVFPYVSNKKLALLNIARALKPTGLAFIGVESFYFGPAGDTIFEGSNFFKWNENHSIVIVKGGITKQEEKQFMSKFKAWEIPPDLLVSVYSIPNVEIKPEVPQFYTRGEQEKLLVNQFKQGHKYQRVAKDLINWNFFEFLAVKTFNPSSAGEVKSNYRPYRFASRQVYLEEKNLTDSELIVKLVFPYSYSVCLLQKGWKPSVQYLAMIKLLIKRQKINLDEFTLTIKPGIVNLSHSIQGLKVSEEKHESKVKEPKSTLKEELKPTDKNDLNPTTPQISSETTYSAHNPSRLTSTPAPRKSACAEFWSNCTIQ